MGEEMTQQDVSARALSIARMIDRLGPGKYEISLIMPKSKTERWTIEITQRILGQPVTIRKELGHPLLDRTGSNMQQISSGEESSVSEDV